MTDPNTRVSVTEAYNDQCVIQQINNLKSGKQDKLTAGTNITISSENVISANDVAANWGSIGGTLSAQTDLQNALNAKADSSALTAEAAARTAADTNLQTDIDTLSNAAVKLTGDQDISGNKTLDGIEKLNAGAMDRMTKVPRTSTAGWKKLYTGSYVNHHSALITVMPRRASAGIGAGILFFGGHTSGPAVCSWMADTLVNTKTTFLCTVESNLITLWGQTNGSTDNYVTEIISENENGNEASGISDASQVFRIADDSTVYTLTESEGTFTGYTDSEGVVHTFLFAARSS